MQPIPQDISYFIASILLQLPEIQQQSSTPKPSNIVLRNVGSLSYIALGAPKSSLMTLKATTNYYYHVRLCQNSLGEGTFSKRNHEKSVEGAVVITFAHVAQALRSDNRSDPRLDNDGKVYSIMQEQYRVCSKRNINFRENRKLLITTYPIFHYLIYL